jgi:UDP:flavonoid glycosyltransferase YjiC (YdhE family)
MKFLFLTSGTDGDTRPLAALAKELIRRGHDARLLADRACAPLALAHGIPFTALAGDIRQAVLPGGQLGAVTQGRADLSRVTRACARIAREHTGAWMATAAQEARGCDVLVFSGLASYVGLAVAEALRISCIGAGLWPMTPTREFGAAFLRPRRLPGWANRFTHRFFGALSWAMFRPAIDAARKQVFGLAPRRRMWSGYPVLYGCSPALVPRPADWPAEVSVTGAWQLGAQQAWQPPPDLAHFLAAGEAPVYVGFGSMAGLDPQGLLQALQRLALERRVLFYPGWSGVDPAALPPGVFVLGDTPHDWLFPRTCAIVHHGGAGTSHAAARSGVPSVVVPFAGDQFFWAGRLAQAGVALACPAQEPGRSDLAGLIAAATAPAMQARARRLARTMAKEDGIAAAVDAMLGGAARVPLP